MANASGLLEQFDLIELKVFDIHGLKKGRLITRARVPGVLQYGLGIRNGECCLFGFSMSSSTTRLYR